MPSPDAVRAGLRALLEDARRDLTESTAKLSAREMVKALPGGWSVKDILAHVAMWDEMELLELQRVARGHRSLFGASFDYSLIDRWNEVQFALRKGFSLRQVREELVQSRRALVDFLGWAPDRTVTSRFARTACRVQAKHDRDHALQIRVWRASEGV